MIVLDIGILNFSHIAQTPKIACCMSNSDLRDTIFQMPALKASTGGVGAHHPSVSKHPPAWPPNCCGKRHSGFLMASLEFCHSASWSYSGPCPASQLRAYAWDPKSFQTLFSRTPATPSRLRARPCSCPFSLHLDEPRTSGTSHEEVGSSYVRPAAAQVSCPTYIIEAFRNLLLLFRTWLTVSSNHCWSFTLLMRTNLFGCISIRSFLPHCPPTLFHDTIQCSCSADLWWANGFETGTRLLWKEATPLYPLNLGLLQIQLGLHLPLLPPR